MPVERLRAGDQSGPYDVVLGADMAAALALATQDSNPRYSDGAALPPTAIATETYRAQFAAMLELVPPSVFAAARSGVHGRHELVLHRPVVPGKPLQTLVELHSARPARDNLRITLLHTSSDARGHVVAEQWWTTVMLGTTSDPVGPELPDPGDVSFDERRVMAEESVRVDLEMARRYAAVSGDFSEHHFDVEAARRSGFDRPFLHGLCTMALCARAVVRTACDDDPSRLRRLAVRFASPAFLDQDLTVRLSGLGQNRVALVAMSGDATVIRDGFVELRSPAAST